MNTSAASASRRERATTGRGTRFVHTIACALLLTAASGAALADTWRWKDENGQWAYSERRPYGKDAERVKLFGTKSTDPGAMQRLREKGDASDTAREKGKQSDELSQALAENDKIAKANCEIARKNLEVLETSKRVQTKDAEGNTVELSETDREAQKAANQKSIDEFCK